MSEHYKAIHPNACYFITCTIVGWVDVFTRDSNRQIVIDSLRYCQETKGLHLYAYVIMTNHIHLLGWVDAPNEIGKVIRDFKRFTAGLILKSIQNEKESRRDWMLSFFETFGGDFSNREQFQLWQKGFHPKEVWSDTVFHQKLDYIHENPVRAGFVREPQDWIYSSASNYVTGKGLLLMERW